MTRLTRFRVGMILGLLHVATHDVERHFRLALANWGDVWLVGWTVIGAAAVYLIATGWRSRSEGLGFGRWETALGGVILSVSSILVVGDLLLTFYFRSELADILRAG